MTTPADYAGALYRVLVNAAPDAVVAIDAKSVIVLANPAMERMFGYSATELLGGPLDRIMPERLRAGHAVGIARYMATGIRNLDWKGVRITGARADGTEFPVLISFGETEILGERAFLGFIRDLSAEEAASTALRDAQRLHEGLLVSVGAGIVGVDASGNVSFANPAACTLLGSSLENLVGRNFHETAHHAHADGRPFPASECALFAALKAGRLHPFADEQFFRSDGSRFPVEGVATPLHDRGLTTGAVVTFQDITERQHLEQQLRHRHKMEGVGQLAGGIAHDFNNLLSVILAHVGFLTEDAEPGEARDDMLAIRQAAERAAALTKQLLAYSRRQVLVPRTVGLFDVVTAVEPMLRRLIGEHINLIAKSSASRDTVLADRGQLEQVITNLVINSRDAMPQGGTLTIEVRDTPEGEGGRGLIPRDPTVMLRVTDTGVGMDSPTRDRAMEPFFTTKSQGEGTGFGLATASGIVSQSGGSMIIASEQGRGTAISIYLPLVDSPVTEKLVELAELVRPARSATVLLAEDEAALRRSCTRILESAGYTVLEARHGIDAKLVAAEFARPIDLLLTDVVMPGMGGVELVRWFAKDYPKAGIVFMSGYTDDERFGNEVADHSYRFLAKPFVATALLAIVADALDSVEKGT